MKCLASTKVKFVLAPTLPRRYKKTWDAIIAVRNGKAIGYVMPGLNGGVELIETVSNPFDLPAAPIRDQGWSVWSDTGIKTDGAEPQGKEWREYDPDAAWRLSPDVDRVEEISQFFGTQITIKWLNGYEKYGTKFKGDPVEHAFLEARDHMVYLWYIREERQHLRQTIPSHERQIEQLHATIDSYRSIGDQMNARINELEKNDVDAKPIPGVRTDPTEGRLRYVYPV